MATASCARSTSMATVRATIMPGTSPMTLTCLPSAWKRPVGLGERPRQVASEAESAIRVAAAVVEREVEVDDVPELDARSVRRRAAADRRSGSTMPVPWSSSSSRTAMPGLADQRDQLRRRAEVALDDDVRRRPRRLGGVRRRDARPRAALAVTSYQPLPVLRPSRPDSTSRRWASDGRELRVLEEGLPHRAGDGLVDVLPDQVGQLEGAHPEAAGLAQHGVDGGRVGAPLLVHRERLGVEGAGDAVDDEARGVGAAHRRLAPRRGRRRTRAWPATASVANPQTTSTSGSSGAGLKKCRPTKRPGCCRAPRDGRHRQGGGVGGEQAVRRRRPPPARRRAACLTSSRSTTASMTSAASARSADALGGAQPGACRVPVGGGQPALLDEPVEAGADRAGGLSGAARARRRAAARDGRRRSATWAMPWPMVPVPTTATVRCCGRVRVMCAILPHGVIHRCGGPPCPDRSFGYSNSPPVPSISAQLMSSTTSSNEELVPHGRRTHRAPADRQAPAHPRPGAGSDPHPRVLVPAPRAPQGLRRDGSLDAAEGKAAFDALLGTRLDLGQPGTDDWVGGEVSPYGIELGVKYPHPDLDVLLPAMRRGACAPGGTRAPEIARGGLPGDPRRGSAPGRTSSRTRSCTPRGQAFMMAFQAGGPHAQDRGLEAVAYAYVEQVRTPDTAEWTKPQGKRDPLAADASRSPPVPRGIGLVIGCNTFPTWNGYPGLFASLATGNPVLVKPHPRAVLPLALTVAGGPRGARRGRLRPEPGGLAAERPGEGIAKTLAVRPEIRIIDYTGSTAFGDWLEANARQAQVYTEKAGVNTVRRRLHGRLPGHARQPGLLPVPLQRPDVHHPAEPADPARRHRAPTTGPRTFDEVVADLAAAVDGLLGDDARANALLGALVNPDVKARLEARRRARRGRPRLPGGRQPRVPGRGRPHARRSSSWTAPEAGRADDEAAYLSRVLRPGRPSPWPSTPRPTRWSCCAARSARRAR